MGFNLLSWRSDFSNSRLARASTLVALRDMLDAMPDKELITGELINKEGQCCALGCLAQAKDINVADIDPEDRRGVAKRFNIAPALAAEIAYENDEGARRSEEETPAKRWERMRAWVADQIKK